MLFLALAALSWHQESVCVRVCECDQCIHSQNLVVAQGLSGWAAVPAAVWDVPVGCDDVERVVDKVVLQDAVVGRAGCQRWGGIDLRSTEIQKQDIYIRKRGNSEQ